MKILLTGASGLVGTDLRPILAEQYEKVILTSRRPIQDLRPNEVYMPGDITQSKFTERLVDGVDGIIHMAGAVGPDFGFQDVMSANVEGSYNVFEAARHNGIKQIIYASSHHAVGFLQRGSRIDSDTALRPDSFYGISKAFGEVMSSYYADKYGMNVMAIRIGYVGWKVVDERRMRTWCSPRDLANLIRIGLETKNLGYRLVYGVSDNPQGFFDNSEAEKIGFKAEDCSLDYLADPAMKTAEPDPESIDDLFIGGYFATRNLKDESLERLRDVNRPLKEL